MKKILFLSLIILSLSENLRFLKDEIPNIKEIKKLANFDKAMDNINGVVDSQKYIAESFKTTLNTTIRSKLKINDYSKLNGKTRMILYNGIERDYQNNEKVNQLFNTLKLKTDEQKIVRNLIEESEYLDKSLLTNIQVLYNSYDSNNDSDISFASIIIINVNNDDEELNVLIFYSFFFLEEYI